MTNSKLITGRCITVAATCAVLAAFTSCKKLVDASPVSRISFPVAYADSMSAESNVTGIYYQAEQGGGGTYTSPYYVVFPLLSDEMSIGSSTQANNIGMAANLVNSDYIQVKSMWAANYAVIYQANSVIENIGAVQMSEARRNRMLGEARFLRAYFHFMAMAYFGKVPIVTTTDFRVNNALPRTDTSTVFRFVTDELNAALDLLPDGYGDYGNRHTRACKQTARALLARVYLYRKDWANAEAMANKIINDPLFTLSTIANLVVPNSTESIWELAASSNSPNYIAQQLLPAPGNPTEPASVPGDRLVQGFENGDMRKDAFIGYSALPAPGYYYVNKYRDRISGTDQPKLLRLSEMYLVRAEARAQQGHFTGSNGAAADINVIRNRAGLGNTTASTREELLAAVAQERFVELCFEGHRWLDLVRTGQADAVLGALKPNTWKPTAKLLPIPATELGANPNLLPQNNGY